MAKFTPSAAEVALVNQIFVQADAQKLGVVTGEAAVKVFGGSKLPPTVLAEIWGIADDENNGVLTRKGVAVAVRLLGHAQRGEQITEDLINKPGPVPTIEGLNAPIGRQSTGIPSTKSPPPGYPPLTAQDRIKFTRLFHKYGPVNGILSGDKARDVLVQSKLPVEKLSQIWSLADSKKRGALDSTDFAIALYFVQALMSSQIQALPPTLPQSIYDQAAGRGGSEGVLSHTTGDSNSLGQPAFANYSGRPISTIQPQYTGQSLGLQPQHTGQALRVAARSPPLPARSSLAGSPPPFNVPSPSVQWDVTPAEKAHSDALFDSRDTQKNGYIEADIAVPLFVQSKLSDDILAQVWDLSDLNSDGRLTKEGFAVAMHLINGKLRGREIPAALPPSLVPPSMRAAAPIPPVQPPVPEAIRDLLWDDTPPPSATVPQAPQPTFQQLAFGAVSPQHTAAVTNPPRPTIYSSPDPFATSPFGASTSPQHDLLGDDDEPTHSSPPLEDKSAEIGNTQNQLSSTNRSLETTRNERANVERVLADQATQLAALQAQLVGAKAAYEKETETLSNLRERYTTQTADIQKTKQELIHAESNLSAVRVEKTEIEGAVLRDKEEVRELQRKMTEVGSQVEMIKVEVEKAKKDAKQQKGLLAIAKKQLATREAERAKEEKRLEEARAEAEAATKEREEAEAELAKEVPPLNVNGHESPTSLSPDILSVAASQPLPPSPEASTPIISPASKSTNPFERLARASASPDRAESPFLPFAATILPTHTVGLTNDIVVPPPEADPASLEDPFGFSAAFGSTLPDIPLEEKPINDDAASEDIGEHGPPPGLTLPPTDVMSPTETDMFVTPLSSAVGAQSPPAKKDDLVEAAATQFPALDAAVAQFPEISPQVPGHFPEEPEVPTFLDSQLKEIDVEESDSEDDEPLTTVKAKLTGTHHLSPSSDTGASAPTPSSAFDDTFGIATSPLPTEGAKEATTPVTPSSAPEGESPAGSALSAAKDLFVASTPPVTQQPALTEITKQNGTGTAAETPAGVNDFDEALGTIPSASGAPAHFTDFSFDTAFDDNFDFAAASAASKGTKPSTLVPNGNVGNIFPPAPSTTGDSFDAVFLSGSGSSPAPSALLPNVASSPAIGPAPASTTQETKPFSFDDAFGPKSVQQSPQPTVQQPAQQITPKPAAQPIFPTPQLNLPPPARPNRTNGSTNISFDDAFGGVSPAEALALDSSFSSATYQPPPGPPPQQQPAPTPFPTASQPSSPRAAETSGAQLGQRRSYTPPPPQASPPPPPRHSSPRLRPSTATSDKEKPPTRHSKLSIRLPFGRKKKHDAHPPPPPVPQQVVEDPTPPADDDIDAVKTICGMGFSRSQAVTALERHGYDVQRALNSLLGSS